MMLNLSFLMMASAMIDYGSSVFLMAMVPTAIMTSTSSTLAIENFSGTLALPFASPSSSSSSSLASAIMLCRSRPEKALETFSLHSMKPLN